jgi:predicted Zn-dependent protease
MHKNNLTKSRKHSDRVEKNERAKKSTSSKKAKNGKKTPSNGFTDLKTLQTNSTWTETLSKHPGMTANVDKAIEAYRSGDTKKAIKLLEHTVVINPLAPLYWYLGHLYADIGGTERAIWTHRTATELAPNSERASLGLFHALWTVDQFSEALDELKRFQTQNDWRCQEYVEILHEISEKSKDKQGLSKPTAKKH